VTTINWWVVIPNKGTWRGKSRIEVRPRVRRELALAMAGDTVRAALNAESVEQVVVVGVGDDVSSFARDGVTTLVDEGYGMNSAIHTGSDLPATRTA